MNLVDSSGWLEYFSDGPNADFFAPAIEDAEALVVSTINLYEVFKRILQQRDEDSALKAVAVMGQGRVIPVDDVVALSAAAISARHRLPMADSLILASARACKAALWTQDADFEGMPEVNYRAAPTS